MTKALTELSPDQIAVDLAVFADIGTDTPTVESTPQGAVVRFTRRGEATEIEVLRKGGALIENWADQTLKHASFKALLASERYGNLREWSANQTALLSQELEGLGSLIAVKGVLSDDSSDKPVDTSQIDDALVAVQGEESTRVLLIDGPAGIGKTIFISNLAYQRAVNYTSVRRPLILHVQSLGRTLSHLLSMLSLGLQRLRLLVTYDQVPVLAKYGLITIAIDGFDELADPDGYDKAWSQVSEMIQNLRGNGSIILAGRETFIGRDRILKDIASIRDGKDEIFVLTLQAPTKATAIAWLREQPEWGEQEIQSIEDFLEPNSLALRPFFLKTLAAPDVAVSISGTSATSVLSILMEAMLEREVGKFGEAIEGALDPGQRKKYLRSLLCEAARDMAESNSTSISDATLSWLVEMALPVEVDESVVRILKARSQHMPFFTNDDRRGYRRFFHDKFYEYFLSLATIDLIISNQNGRILSRNILGSSFLETFGDVVGGAMNEKQVKNFCDSLISTFNTYPPIDRTRRNLGALAVASLTVAEYHPDFVVRDIDLDECRVAGTASGGTIRSVMISQLDCRGANLAEVEFASSSVLSLIADQQTVLPNDFPMPQQIRDISKPSGTIFAPAEIQEWVHAHFENPPVADNSLVPADLQSHPALRLVQRACRMRQYWLRESDDIYAEKVLRNEYWPMVSDALSKNNLLTVEDRQASGAGAPFVHIKQRSNILAEEQANADVKKFYVDLVNAIRHMETTD